MAGEPGLMEKSSYYWRRVEEYAEVDVEELLREANDDALMERGVSEVGEHPPSGCREAMGGAQTEGGVANVGEHPRSGSH